LLQHRHAQLFRICLCSPTLAAIIDVLHKSISNSWLLVFKRFRYIFDPIVFYFRIVLSIMEHFLDEANLELLSLCVC
jgi:hypothetical protein